jgi:circadian clock protein KaiC
VEQVSPGVMVVDSFRTITRAADGRMDLQSFLERLAIQLTSWQATTFLVGEYPETEVAENAILPLPTASCGCTSTSTATLACASSRR